MARWYRMLLAVAILVVSTCNAFTGESTAAAGPKTPRVLEEDEPELAFRQSIELADDSALFQKQSEYQLIEVHRSKHFGNILVLDDVLQITERDGDSYNEMMAHVPLFQHPNPKRVLVIGGGDGYVLSEVLKHKSVEHVDHVDLDGEVIETCKKFFPWGQAWDDPRAKLHIADGAKFVRDAPEGFYDVIIQDSSDPWFVSEDGTLTPLPSGVLYEESHFVSLHKILSTDGVLCLQAESYNVPSSLNGVSQWRTSLLLSGFERVRYGSLTIPSYPMGQIGFLLGEKSQASSAVGSNATDRYESMVSSGMGTTYYHPPLQESSFHIPLWAHRVIYRSSEPLDHICEKDSSSKVE